MSLRCASLITRSISTVLAIVFIAIAFCSPAKLAAQAPIGSWSFDEGSGTTAFDGSGNQRNVTLPRGIRWVLDDRQWAISAESGSGAYVSTPVIDFRQARAVSISVWLKRNWTATGHSVLVEGSDEAGSGFAIDVDDATCGGIQAAQWGKAGRTANCYSAPSSGVWHQLAVVYDRTRTGGDAVVLYVDGTPQTPIWNVSSATATEGFGDTSIYLFSQHGTSQSAAGTVRDLAIFDSALTPEAVQRRYLGEQQGATQLSGLVASYDFDEGSGETVTDSSGNGNTGIISNAIWSEAGKHGGAVVFNGNDSLITVPDSPSLQLRNSMTLEAWVNPSILNGLWRNIIDKGSDYSLIAIAPGKGVPAFRGTIGTSDVLSLGTATLPVNTWSHLAVTYDGAFLRSYINGVLASSQAYRGEIASSSSPLQIGGDRIPGRYFDGKIDDVRIYNVTLSQSQIQDDMTRPVKSQGSMIAPGDVDVFVGPANFTIAASPSSLTIAQGSQGESTITSTTHYGFNSAVYLSATGVPNGTTVSFVPNHIAAPGNGNSTMTIFVGANTAPGSYAITVFGMGGMIQQRTATVTLTVTAPTPDYTIAANPSSLSLVPGQQGSSTITTAISGGFNSAITLSASGLPNGTTVSFAPNPIAAPGNGYSTMTISVGSGTAVGTYPITVTGNGGGIQHATTVTLTVASIALDGDSHGVQDSGLTSTSTESVSLGTPTAGDLITCEVALNAGSNNSLLSVSDNNNGSYAAAIPIALDPDMSQWFGIYYIENASGSPTTVTVQTVQSQPFLAISCQAWIGADSSDSLDEAFSQLQDGVSAPDPSTGSNNTPATDGELVIASVGLHTSGPPTAGANYSLIDGAQTTQWWPEYWIQNSATPTAGDYTWPVDTWADNMVGFLSGSARNFSLSASPNSLSVVQGQQGTSTITATIRRGFNNAINLTASGVPSGTTVSFAPNPIAAPGNGSSTMTINVGSGTAVGTYPITVTGNGGGIQHSTTVTLTVSASPDYSISASPSSVSLVQGQQGSSTVTTAISGGFNNAITLSATGVPNGTTVSFNPNPIAAPGNGTSTMTIVVGANTAVGTYPITVTGNGGGIQHSTTVTLTVTAPANFTLSASPTSLSIVQGSQGTSTLTTTISGGFNSAITLSASGVPTGTTVSFNPNPIAAPGNGTSTMTIVVGANTAVGTYHITVTGSGGGIQQTATVTLTVTAPPNFTLSASPTSLSIVQGSQGTSTLTTTISGGFNSAITLSASGVPTGTTVGFNPNPIAAPGNGTSTMTIVVGANTAVGTYPMTVTGSGGGIQQTATVTLTVTAPPNFTLSASPTSLSIVQGSQGTSTLTTTISGGFNSAITLSASGVPTGTTVGFNPNPIAAPGNGTSTMTIVVGANTAVGTYPVTVTGNGGGIQHSTTVTLTVTAPPNFTLSASPTSLSIVQGSQGTSTLTTTISGGFNGAITLSASGVPTGTTVSFNPNPIAAPGNGTSTMTIVVGANTAVGTYPITVTGNGGGIQHSTTVTLTVTAPANFTLSASPMALSLLQASQGTSTITTTISGGFNSAISLSANGVPNGTIVSFSPNPIAAPGAGQSTMTITVGMNTLQGTYPIVITGSGGGVQQAVTFTLTVTADVYLSWNASGSQGIAGYNVYRSLTTGGPYTKMNSGLVVNTNYMDQAVQDGYTYYYVSTAVNQQQQESGYSNEASAYVP